MFISVSFRTSTFPSTKDLQKLLQNSLNSFLYTLNISFSIILNFTSIVQGKGNTNVNFPKVDIMMTFFKY